MSQDPVKLFEEHRFLVYGAIKKYAPTFLHDEDMIQEGMIGLWKACLAYDSSKSAVSTFVYSCVRNEILMAIKKGRNRVPTVSINEPIGSNGWTIGDLIEDPTNYFGVAELDVDAAVKRLSARQKQVWDLLLKGLNQNEISSLLGLSQSYISRVRTKILKILTKYA